MSCKCSSAGFDSKNRTILYSADAMFGLSLSF